MSTASHNRRDRYFVWVVVTAIAATLCVALMLNRQTPRAAPKPATSVSVSLYDRALRPIDQIGLLQKKYPDFRAPEYVAGIRDVWNQLKDTDQVEMLKAGTCLLNALHRHEDFPERVKVAAALVYAIERNRSRWENPPIWSKETIDSSYVSCLVHMQSADSTGEYETALFALGRLLNHAQSHNDQKQIEMYEHDIVRVEEAMRQKHRTQSTPSSTR